MESSLLGEGKEKICAQIPAGFSLDPTPGQGSLPHHHTSHPSPFPSASLIVQDGKSGINRGIPGCPGSAGMWNVSPSKQQQQNILIPNGQLMWVQLGVLAPSMNP